MTTTIDCHYAKLQAAKMRADAFERRDQDSLDVQAQIDLIDADVMEQEADATLLDIGPMVNGAGGELVPVDPLSRHGLTNIVARPNKVTHGASVERLNLVHGADVFNLAIDVAESMNARNSVERMLTHQMAAAHKAAMDLIGGNRLLRDPLDETRRINSAARMMTVFQQGALTLQKLRSGGNQTVTVRHITIAPGAQAVIGNVDRGEARRGGGGAKDG